MNCWSPSAEMEVRATSNHMASCLNHHHHFEKLMLSLKEQP